MAFEANNNDFDKKRGFTQQWYDSKVPQNNLYFTYYTLCS